MNICYYIYVAPALMDLKITDFSLSFNVRGIPNIPVCDTVVLAIDTRKESTERVVKAGIDLPSWMIFLKHGYLKLVYLYNKRHVDCTFKESKSILTFYGIKRDDGCFAVAFNLLGVEPVETPVAAYRATLVLDVGARWNKHAVADIITNDPEISQVAAVSEVTSTLCRKSLFSVSVCTEHGEYVKMALRHDDHDERKTIVTMSKLPNKNVSVYVSRVAARIFEIYTESHQVESLPFEPMIKISGITHLRNELPELFINNYTRECPVLPIMLSEEQAKALKDIQRVIFYPTNSPMGRYYTAPDGYFVGLKKNRLPNKYMFPYLVTSYLQDHMLRVRSETNAYYTGQKSNKQASLQSKRIPRFLDYIQLESGYSRQKASSFVNAIEAATGCTINTDNISWCPQVVKQDMYNVSDADIMDAIYNKSCGPSAYRYFEELLNISIHVISISNTMSGFFASGLRGYIWAAPYDKHVIIFENAKSAYSQTYLSYDFLVGEKNLSMFGDNDPVVSSVLLQKYNIFEPPDHIPNVVGQLIDEKGKCRVAITKDNDSIMTLTRPFKAAVIPEPASFFDEHITKMNEIKSNIGLPTTDLYKRSTLDVLYFSNDQSFEYWKEHIRQ